MLSVITLASLLNATFIFGFIVTMIYLAGDVLLKKWWIGPAFMIGAVAVMYVGVTYLAYNNNYRSYQSEFNLN